MEFAVWLRKLKQGLCINLEGWDGEGEGREVQKGGDRGRSRDGGGIGRRDHFLPYKFIKRTIQRRANFTKQLLITS